MSYIKLNKITKVYNPHSEAMTIAVNQLDLNIEKGELVAIIGKSGSGKSTLLHIIGTLDQATDGSYELDQRSIGEMNLSQLAIIRNQEIGFVLQEFGLLLNKSVYDNISVPYIFSPKASSSRSDSTIEKMIDNVLDEVGLSNKKNSIVSQLSGGQKQRVAIARAIINNPNMILADEPTGALDEVTSKEIMDLLIKLNNHGKTVIIVTHDMRIAEQCSRIIKIVDGKIADSICREMESNV